MSVERYLDHASTSPMRPEARAAILDALDGPLGDPSRTHAAGLRARALLEDARSRIAAVLGARPREVVFTSGSTESIASVCWGVRSRGPAQVAGVVEREAVRVGAATHGSWRPVPCDGTGRMDPDAVIAAVDDEVAVVHVQWGNQEVGTLQPVGPVIAYCRERGALVHVDAAHALGRVPFSFHDLGADLVSGSGHRLGGPAGIGLLLVRRGVRLDPLLVGGEQERARRGGMENVMAAVGLAAAVEAADPIGEGAAQARLRDRLHRAIADVDGTAAYGHPEERLPHIVCAGISDIEPQAVLLGLDRRGIRAHSGSACASEGLEPSPVLEAMGADAHHSLRVSVGWSSTDDDVDAFATALPEVVAELRALRAG